MSNDQSNQSRSTNPPKKGHGIQFNLPSAKDLYAPARDFAHNYPLMVKSIIAMFNHNYWPELFAFLVQSSGLSEDEAFDRLEAAKDVYCKFLNHSCDDSTETVEAVLRKVGWLDVPLAVQVAWFAMLGQVVTGQLFAGIRDLTSGNKRGGKIDEVRYFIEQGHAARRALNGVTTVQETAYEFRKAVRAARTIGLSFEDIHELVFDVQHGRALTERD